MCRRNSSCPSWSVFPLDEDWSAGPTLRLLPRSTPCCGLDGAGVYPRCVVRARPIPVLHGKGGRTFVWKPCSSVAEGHETLPFLGVPAAGELPNEGPVWGISVPCLGLAGRCALPGVERRVSMIMAAILSSTDFILASAGKGNLRVVDKSLVAAASVIAESP